jgi:hypothetical protein
MSRDIIIYPNRNLTGSTEQPLISFSGLTSGSINLVVEDDGSLTFDGSTGSLFGIIDNKDGLLHSVNDVSGLPIFQVWDNDMVIIGQWDDPTLIVSGETFNIVGGQEHLILPGVTNTTIMGGQGITGDTSFTTYVPNLNIDTIGSGTSVNNLGVDSNGNVVVGVNIFVSGATMSGNTLELSRTGGLSDVTVDLSQFIDDTVDGVVSGATMNGNTLELGRTQGLPTLTTDLSQFLDNTNNYVTGFTYNNSNVFTVSVSDGNDYTATIDVMSGLTVNGDLNVNGQSVFSGTTDVVTIIGSGSTVFSIQGSAGELFAVNDSLTGVLFSVNDISGLPILEVNDDDTILMGSYLAPSLNTTSKITANSGTTVAYTLPSSDYTSAFFDYSVYGSTGARAGTVMSIWSGSSVQYNDVSTNDIGDTSDVTMFVDTTSSIGSLKVLTTTDGWVVKTITRSI